MITYLTPQFVELIPEILEEGILYVSFEYKVSLHYCPCGCGNKVILPFGQKGWEIKQKGNLISFSPSIGSWNLECKSHYFIIENEVRFC